MAELLDSEGIAHKLITALRPTTIKNRIIAGNQQMLRVDEEKKRELSTGTWTRFHAALSSLPPEYEVAVVSDYGKGVVSDVLLDALEQRESLDKVLVDPKIEHYPLYKNHYLMTPNAKEAGESTHSPMKTIPEILEVGRTIMRDKALKNLLITLGSRGMALFGQGETAMHIPTVAQNVYDVTGAGDTVIAALAWCLSSGVDLLTSCVIANGAAGVAVGQVGTAAISPEDLQKSFDALALPEVSSWA